MNKIRVLSCNIYRDSGKGGDCSNHGISSRFNDVLIPCDDGYLEVDLDNPPENLCKVVKRNLGFTEYVHIEPYRSTDIGNVGWMHGGCLVHSSDSRFSRAVGIEYPVCLHDRQETQEMYDMMW